MSARSRLEAAPRRLDGADQLRHDLIVGVRQAENNRASASDEPTDVQMETLDMIRVFVAEHGHSPSLRDIMDALNIQLSTVTYRLHALRRKGYVRWEHGSSRTLVVINRAPVVPVVSEPAADPCLACGGTGRAGGETP